MKKNCYNCKYYKSETYLEPCNSCINLACFGVEYAGFVEKEREPEKKPIPRTTCLWVAKNIWECDGKTFTDYHTFEDYEEAFKFMEEYKDLADDDITRDDWRIDLYSPVEGREDVK